MEVGGSFSRILELGGNTIESQRVLPLAIPFPVLVYLLFHIISYLNLPFLLLFTFFHLCATE